MCGIVYLRRSDGKAAAKQVLKRYTQQQDRGSDGFGYVAIGKDAKITAYDRFQTEQETRDALKNQRASHLLFHHRFPTSTVNVPESAHPIVVDHKELRSKWYVVHNGVISNPDSLRTQHIALGYRYATDVTTQYKTASGRILTGETHYNDSEAFAIELVRAIEGKQKECGARGPIAYIALEVDKRNGRLIATYYGTNGGNPLTINRANGVMIASEGGKAINDNICYRIDAKTLEESVTPLLMAHYSYSTPYAGIGFKYTYPDAWSAYQRKEHGLEKAGYDASDDENAYMPSARGASDVSELEELERELVSELRIAKECGEEEEQLNIEMDLEAVREDLLDAKTHAVLDF